MSSRSLNKVMLIGNLTREPNLRYTPNNTAVCSFGLATNRSWTPTDGGEKQESVEYHNIVSWSKLAEICGQLLHKGDKIYVDGRLQTRDWRGDDGQDRRTTEIVIENMILLRSSSGQGEGEGYSAAPAGPSGPSTSANQAKPSKGKTAAKSSAQLADDQISDDVTNVEDIADDVPF